MIVGEEILAPASSAISPAGRGACARCKQQRMLGKGRRARAESAADIDHVDAHLFGRHAQHHAPARRASPGRPDGRSGFRIGRWPRRRRRARRASPSCWARRAGFRSRRAPCTRRPAMASSVLASLPYSKSKQTLPGILSWRSGAPGSERRIEADHRRQILIFDLDEIGRIDRRSRRLGDHHRDLLAGEAHAVAGQHRPLRHDAFHAAAAREMRHRRQSAEARIDDVGAGEDGDHAGRAPGRAGVDRADLRMGAVGAAEHGVKLARQVPVGGIAARAR